MSANAGVRARKRLSGKNGNGAARCAGLTVRPASRGDLVPLNFFFDALLRRDYFMRRGQLADLISGSRHQVYVAEIDGVLVGVAVTTRGSRLVNALVHPAYRGLGIGRELVNCTGATEVRAKLDMSGGDPRGFYRSLGFVSTGVRNDKGNVEVLRRPRTVAGNGQQARARGRRTRTGELVRKQGVAANGRKSRK
jgi:ribosomal protein S18 acetylase RimI-like enzyme